MSEIQIMLHFNRADFEAIYFKNNQESIFFSKYIKRYFLLLLIFTIAFTAVIIYDVYANTFLSISILLFFMCVFAAYIYTKATLAILKWKRSVHTYLDSISGYNNYKLILTENAIALCMDNKEIIEKWSAITGAIINDEYISLTSPLTHLYPRKSMSDEDYELLKAFVAKTIKN